MYAEECLKSGIDAILIDDRIRNCEQWINAGGIAVHHTSLEQTLLCLREMGLTAELLTHSPPYSKIVSEHEQGQLAKLWSSASECFIGIPGSENDSQIFIAPVGLNASKLAETASQCLDLPQVLKDVVVFALTAFNPLGQNRQYHLNLQAHKILAERLKTLDPAPHAQWRSFGFSLTENWREDGFCIAYSAHDLSNIALAQKAVLTLAVEFEQGAIFEYHYHADKAPNLLFRSTVPCAFQDAASFTIEAVGVIPSLPMQSMLTLLEYPGQSLT